MTDLLDILNEVVENDEVEKENQFEELPPEENEYEDRQDTELESTDSDTGFETGVSNSIGRGAVENIIKNTVYEKYNIDGKAMKDFSRLSPTEMISDFKGSVYELGRIREDYKNGIYTKAEYNALSSRVKGEISGKMLEIGSCRKSILEDTLLRSFGVKPSDFSNVKTFKDLISVFEEDKEIKGESEINLDTETDTDKEPDIPENDALNDAELNENDAENIKEAENMAERENEEQQENAEPDTDIPEEALDEPEKETKDPTDAEFSPDNAAEDIGEMAEEIGEAAEDGEAIIAALL